MPGSETYHGRHTHGKDRHTQDSDEGEQGSENDVRGRMERVAVTAQHQGMPHREEVSMCADANGEWSCS